MSKTSGLVVFFVVATVFNLALMAIFLTVIIGGGALIMGSNPNQMLFTVVMFLGFIAAIVLTFLVYGWVMKKAVVRFNLEKHLPQLFKKKK